MKNGGVKFEYCREGDLSGYCRTDSPVSLFEPTALFDANGALICKVGSKITSAVAGEVFVKCYFYKSFLSRFRHFFRVSRAQSCVSCALAVQRAGVPTPAPWGYLRESGMLFPHRDFLFTEVLAPDTLFMPAFMRKSPEEAVIKITGCVVKLHQFGILHGDLSLRNLYLTPAGEAGVIDLDGCKLFKGPLPLKKRTQEMARVISSAAKVTDQLSLSRFKELFLAEYKSRSGIDLASSSLDFQTEYLFNRRRA